MYAHPLIHAELAHQRRRDLQADGRRPVVRGRTGELSELVSAARSGSADAWESLVARFTPAIRAVVGGYRLDAADVEDVVQTTWATAFAQIARIRRPEAIGGWLRVTASREALHAVQRRHRELPVDELPHRTADRTPEHALLAAEQREIVHAALGRLPDRERTLLTALDQGAVSYADVARKLNIPIGSIGPTRERALARLRRDSRLAAIRHTAA